MLNFINKYKYYINIFKKIDYRLWTFNYVKNQNKYVISLYANYIAKRHCYEKLQKFVLT